MGSPRFYSALKSKVLISAQSMNILSLSGSSPDGSTRFLQLFDAKATADVTLGTTVPTLSIPMPASGAPFYLDLHGVHFKTGIVAAATTTATGSTEATTGAVVNLVTA